MKQNTVCVVGNPNCGKTTLFNALTGARQNVGNWPGVTVEKKSGTFELNSQTVELVDLPGIYSIVPGETTSEDERVARDYVMSDQAQVVVNIVDAANLERNLYLTAQLIEMQVPMIVVVNMLDIARHHHLDIDVKALEKALGCPVVAMVAARSKGIEEFKTALAESLVRPVTPPMAVQFDPRIEQATQTIKALLQASNIARSDWVARHLMERAYGIEETIPAALRERARAVVDAADAQFDGDLDIALADARYQFVAAVAQKVISRRGELSLTLTDRIDRVVLNRWLGLPIFLFVMYLMFLFTQNLGAAFIDFFDILVGGVMVDGLGGLLDSVGSPGWLRTIVADGIGGGLQTVSTFIPVIFFLYLFLAVLEDSGYMARAAFVMDRLMRYLGLPGKAFVPLIVGFGCNVPSIMATRTMDRASDRIITIMMAPFMSCGARLPVYVLFATAFFPTNGQNLVFALYLIGIAAAIVTGFMLKKIALPGQASAFVMEIPPYHIPTVSGVLLRTWDRLKGFILRAGRVIVVIVACLGFLNSMGTDGSFGNQDSEKSVLSAIGQTIVPVLHPLGVSQENWPAAVGVFTGILAKEAVVGTMNSLYDTMAQQANAKADGASETAEQAVKPWSFSEVLGNAGQSVVDNLKGLAEAFGDPIGLHVDDLSDVEKAAESQEVSVTTISLMQTLFGSSLAAFAYLLMVLLYMPCGAAVAAVWREAGTAWTLFLCCWTTVLGYSSATIVYRLGTFSQDPVYSSIAVSACVAVLALMAGWMRLFAQRNRGKGPCIIPIAVRA